MFSVPHLVIIFIVALIVFGPEKLPELARNLGKLMAEFRRVTTDVRSNFEEHLRELEREADSRKQLAAPSQPSSVPDAVSTPSPGDPRAASNSSPAPSPADTASAADDVNPEPEKAPHGDAKPA